MDNGSMNEDLLFRTTSELIEAAGDSFDDIPSHREFVRKLDKEIFLIVERDNVFVVFHTKHRSDFKKVLDTLSSIQGTVTKLIFFEKEQHFKTLNDIASQFASGEHEAMSDALLAFKALVNDAISQKASDIHIYRTEQEAEITFRVESDAVTVKKVSAEESDQMLRAAFFAYKEQTSKHQSWDSKEEQSYSLQLRVKPEGFNKEMLATLRYEHGTSYFMGGYDAAMRISLSDGSNESIMGLDELGYEALDIRLIEHALMLPRGLVLLSGPTNSGKSTTVRAMIKWLLENKPYVRIHEIGDPIEHIIKNVRQTSIKNSGDGKGSFGKACISLKRRDTNVIVLTEIRDQETIDAVINLAESGHLVIASVHANSATSVVSKLYNGGMPLHVLSEPGFLNLSIFQRLLPKLNDKKITKHFDEIEDEKLKRQLKDSGLYDLSEDKMFCFTDPDHPRGGGMTVCSEFFVPDYETLEHISRKDFLGLEKAWKSRANEVGTVLRSEAAIGLNALDHALEKVLRKEVDPYAVIHEFGSLTINRILSDGKIKNDEVTQL
jgi:type II secretory ATPase GspE/PulE/Tfp pilus assembly ATPase PilB-like protein